VRDPRRRLDRELLGESVLAPRPMHDKVVRKELVAERTVKVPERSGGRVGKARPYRHIPEAGPNAPKLIRLIRNPVSLELARPVPNKEIPRRTPTEWLKPESARLVREALSGREKPGWPKPTREKTCAPSRPRASASAWLGRGEEE
jgi:hypothetical protein